MRLGMPATVVLAAGSCCARSKPSGRCGAHVRDSHPQEVRDHQHRWRRGLRRRPDYHPTPRECCTRVGCAGDQWVDGPGVRGLVLVGRPSTMPSSTPSSGARRSRIWTCAWPKPGCGRRGQCAAGSAADLAPQLNASASAARAQQSRNQPLIGSLPVPPNFPFEYSVYQAGFDTSWELDVFGGKRRAHEAATADWQGRDRGSQRLRW